MPTWLDSEYQQLRERLTAEMKKSMSGLPMCYEHHTFYEGPENPFLIARSTFQLSVGIFHQPWFFIWLPHVLVDRIPCPACRVAGCQPVKSACVYLQKHGFARSPHRVVDTDQNIYVSCGLSVPLWPQRLSEELPKLEACHFCCSPTTYC
jgi:hypothetical protein